nr:hypothetical protein [Nanchangia anserum]
MPDTDNAQVKAIAQNAAGHRRLVEGSRAHRADDARQCDVMLAIAVEQIRQRPLNPVDSLGQRRGSRDRIGCGVLAGPGCLERIVDPLGRVSEDVNGACESWSPPRPIVTIVVSKPASSRRSAAVRPASPEPMTIAVLI